MDEIMKIPEIKVEHLGDQFLGGEQYIVQFPNGYGASIVRNGMSYGGPSGLWELAVLHNVGNEDEMWPLCYATPITNDVIGWLTPEGVANILADIRNLLPKMVCNHDHAKDFLDYDLEKDHPFDPRPGDTWCRFCNSAMGEPPHNLESEDEDAGYLH